MISQQSHCWAHLHCKHVLIFKDAQCSCCGLAFQPGVVLLSRETEAKPCARPENPLSAPSSPSGTMESRGTCGHKLSSAGLGSYGTGPLFEWEKFTKGNWSTQMQSPKKDRMASMPRDVAEKPRERVAASKLCASRKRSWSTLAATMLTLQDRRGLGLLIMKLLQQGGTVRIP